MKGLLSRFRVTGPAARTGTRKRNRAALILMAFVGFYGAIGGRLVQYGLTDPEVTGSVGYRQNLASRPDIVDRNGEVLATDINTASLFAEPRRIVDADEAIERLSSVLSDLDMEETYRKLKSGAGFVWLRRELTPGQQADIMALGIPGIGFRTEKRRFYPGGPTASHILGLVNIDNQGIAGLEKYIDDQGFAELQSTGLASSTDLEPFKLSVDLRVQHIVRDEIARGMERYHAIAAGGVVLNVKTGEVVAMASVPDFDPNKPFNALDPDRLNRMSAGVYEMGSTFKTFTTAMALDSGKVTLASRFDATRRGPVGAAGGADYADDEALYDRVAALSDPKAPVFVIVEPWTPPDRAFRRLLDAIRARGGAARTINVLLTAGAGPAEVDIWAGYLAELGDIYLALEREVSVPAAVSA